MSETLQSPVQGPEAQAQAEAMNPNIEALANRFHVSNETANVINSLDKGAGIHAGGAMSDAEMAPGGATGIDTQHTWARLRDKYGEHDARQLFDTVSPMQGEKQDTFSSHELKIPTGMTLEDARDMVVYGMSHSERGVAERPPVKLTAQDTTEGDPSVLIGTATLKESDGKLSILEVATGKDDKGNVIGFSVKKRAWDRAKDEAYPQPKTA